jgi:CPA2 family monovalent cation:H+ antiporter-2
VGEFSFVLARIGVVEGAIPATLFDLTLATAVVTIALTPAVLRSSPFVESFFARLPHVGVLFEEPARVEAPVAALRDHTIIEGYGRVGKELADELYRRGAPFVVVEYNPALFQELRAEGVPVVYGDAANPLVLERAGVPRARLLAGLVPSPTTAELATKNARAMNPNIDIIARASRSEDLERLRLAGADELIQPEFEAGIEVIGLVLRRYGVSDPDLARTIADYREAFYRRGVAHPTST